MLKSTSKAAIFTDALVILALSFVASWFKLSFVFALVLNILIAVFLTRRGAFCTCLVCVAGFLISFAVSCFENIQIMQAVIISVDFVITFFLTGIAVALILKYATSIYSVMLYGSFPVVLSMVLNLAKIKFVHKLDFLDIFVNKPVDTFFNTYFDIVRSTYPEITPDMLNELNGYIWQVKQYISMVVPSVIIIFALLFSFLVFLITRKLLLRRYDISFENLPRFCHIKMKRATTVFMTVLFILSAFVLDGMALSVVTNIIIVMFVIYIITGFSVTDFFVRKKIKNPVSRAIIYILGFVFTMALSVILPILNVFLILFFIGSFDSVSDFRKLERRDDFV